MEEGIPVLQWPACSPDLNPIENLWGDMVTGVYKNFQHYDNEFDLCVAIRKAWRNITNERCENIVHSMNNRCVQVLRRGGNKTSY